MSKRPEILEALRSIAKKNGGLVRPAHVVAAAKDADSPLHDEFTWDDRKAAGEYRLWQARELLAQYWVVEHVSNEPVRLMLSLTSDRTKTGGYRFSDAVLDDPAQRAEWLQMALGDLVRWQRQYGALTELSAVFAAIERATKRAATSAAA